MYLNSRMLIQEFSYLTGISRDSLRFYDKIDLLSPEFRGENGYRYYTSRQIDMAFLISDLRAIGIGLEEIRQYANDRSPERMLTFLSQQEKRIEGEIQHLRSIQELMRMRAKMATIALQYKEDIVVLEEREQEPLFLCPFQSNADTEADRLTESYNYAAAQGINVGFPSGAILSQENLAAGGTLPAQYYFKTSKEQNFWKSAGTYAVFYRGLSDDSTDEFYTPLLTFIRENNLHMEGDAYEEYLLDELSMHNWQQYKLRIEVRVIA